MGSYGIYRYDCKTNSRGNIDRKATLDNEHTGAHYGVVKSSMVGATYYAVRWYDDDEGKRKHFLEIDKTWLDSECFWYKPMEDTMEPTVCNCPKTILLLADTLCPCDESYDPHGHASRWRMKCYENLEAKKAPTAFSKVKVGDWIEWHVPEDSGLEVQGTSIAGRTIDLTKWAGRRSWITYDFGGPMRVPIKYVNPSDCKPKA